VRSFYWIHVVNIRNSCILFAGLQHFLRIVTNPVGRTFIGFSEPNRKKWAELLTCQVTSLFKVGILLWVLDFIAVVVRPCKMAEQHSLIELDNNIRAKDFIY